MVATKAKERVMKFRLLRGDHEQARYPQIRRKNLFAMTDDQLKDLADEVGADTSDCFDRAGIIRMLKGSDRYSARDPKHNIVSSTVDLETKFGREKFQNLERLSGIGSESLQDKIREQEEEIARLKAQLEENQPKTELDELDLQSMTVADLKKLADELDVDLEPGLRKEEIINVLRSELDTQ